MPVFRKPSPVNGNNARGIYRVFCTFNKVQSNLITLHVHRYMQITPKGV